MPSFACNSEPELGTLMPTALKAPTVYQYTPTPLKPLSEGKQDGIRKIWEIPENEIIAMQSAHEQRWQQRSKLLQILLVPRASEVGQKEDGVDAGVDTQSTIANNLSTILIEPDDSTYEELSEAIRSEITNPGSSSTVVNGDFETINPVNPTTVPAEGIRTLPISSPDEGQTTAFAFRGIPPLGPRAWIERRGNRGGRRGRGWRGRGSGQTGRGRGM
ncbi:hypothetical protein DFH27DRAFT_609662 [Peziza echinospora]|nr:hypothetical protein DFH27DRAFT_609662 [Peziza echinospora]